MMSSLRSGQKTALGFFDGILNCQNPGLQEKVEHTPPRCVLAVGKMRTQGHIDDQSTPFWKVQRRGRTFLEAQWCILPISFLTCIVLSDFTQSMLKEVLILLNLG